MGSHKAGKGRLSGQERAVELWRGDLAVLRFAGVIRIGHHLREDRAEITVRAQHPQDGRRGRVCGIDQQQAVTRDRPEAKGIRQQVWPAAAQQRPRCQTIGGFEHGKQQPFGNGSG